MLKPVHLLMLLAGLLLCASSALRAAAQETDGGLNTVARKFDEFGEVRGCDAGARLDNFAIQLQNEPASLGYIVSYGPEGEGFGTGRDVLGIITDYLVSTRGIAAGRFKTIYAGRYKEWKEVATQLWIAPPDAAPPEPLRYDPQIETFTGKFEEFETYDNRDLYPDAGTGPPLSSTSRANFADLLHEQTETRAVIVAYNLKGALPGAWRRAAKEAADDLRKDYKVEAERIEIIYGGYREQKEKSSEYEEPDGAALVQLWILPKDAPPPVAAVEEAEERPSEAMQLGSFSDYMLTSEEHARRAFEGFADVLRSDEQLNACLIVRIEKKVEETAETEETKEAAEVIAQTANELPKADIMALIEKWRADLVKDYGISEHRLLVATAAKDDDHYYELETWIVPRGAALPDPNAKSGPDSEEFAVEEEMVTDEATQKEF
jgi:hypothetical protein